MKALNSEKFNMCRFFKANSLRILLILDSYILLHFMRRAFLFVLLGFSFFAVSSAKGTSDKAVQKRGIKQSESIGEGRPLSQEGSTQTNQLRASFLDERREKEELKARGVIVKFHRWPNLKQRREVAQRLKSSGLKKTKSIKSFQTQLFEWSEGGLKPSQLGKRACGKIKSLSYVKRCNPDHLLPLNDSLEVLSTRPKKEKPSYLFENAISPVLLAVVFEDKKTEAGFVEDCPSCRKQSKFPELPLDIRTCKVISYKRHLMGGRLSDYWAQELIGSDLLREELKKTSPPERPNWIAVFDSREDDHNVHVKNLISDEEFHDKDFHAVLPELGDKTAPFFQTKGAKEYESVLSLFETGFPGDYISYANYLRKAPPHFINNSMGWIGNEGIYEAFQKLSPPAIVVVSSGNSFPSRQGDLQSKASEDFDAILVGSFSPRGFVSEFSSSEKEVTILAPSDEWISTAGKNWEYKKFGGTSGAAPLVTGSLAGFEWLSGYHPTPEEAKILLEKTAFPTLHSHEEPQINGAGMMNAYKLGEVGKRLKEKCKGKSPSCFKDEILNEENYRFDQGESLKRDLSRVFPDCAIGKELAISSERADCEEKEEIFTRLRKAILLNPQKSKEFLKSLSCIYNEGGFTQNAKALDKLGLALGSREEVRTAVRNLAEKREPISDDMLRLMIGMGEFEEEFKLFEDMRAIKMAGGIGEATLPLLEKAFDTGHPDLQVEAVWATGQLGKLGLPLLEKAFDTGNPDLQLNTLQVAGSMGKPGLRIVEKPFNTDDIDLQMEAVRLAGRMGKTGLLLLKRVSKHKNLDPRVRIEIDLTIRLFE